MAGMWLVETVLSQAILLFTGGVEAQQMTNGKPGKILTFPLFVQNPTDRLRYPPVSLFFMMCLCLQIPRLVQEKLFDIEFVVIIGRLLGAKFAWWRNHEMTKFWPDLPFPKGYANFGGPAGGRSLRARCPLWQGGKARETLVLLYFI